MQKACRCDIKVCLGCLSSSAKSCISRKVKPVCPNMVSFQPAQRCEVPLDPSLLGQMLRNQCPTCPEGASGKQHSGPLKLMDVGCALEAFHKFCPSCLRSDAVKSICSLRMLPRCLRCAECKFEYNEESLRAVLTATDEGCGLLGLGT